MITWQLLLGALFGAGAVWLSEWIIWYHAGRALRRLRHTRPSPDFVDLFKIEVPPPSPVPDDYRPEFWPRMSGNDSDRVEITWPDGRVDYGTIQNGMVIVPPRTSNVPPTPITFPKNSIQLSRYYPEDEW